MKDASHDATDANIRLIIAGLSARELDALTRFYLLEQTPEQIHNELGMAADRLQELKARVFDKFFNLKKPS